jgi:hypothetical protein
LDVMSIIPMSLMYASTRHYIKKSSRTCGSILTQKGS